ncbi:hypothetical protein [Sulfitobacter sp. M13]
MATRTTPITPVFENGFDEPPALRLGGSKLYGFAKIFKAQVCSSRGQLATMETKLSFGLAADAVIRIQKVLD